MAKSRKKVTEELARVRYIGPTLAETLYDDHDIRTVQDIVDFGEEGNLPELKGVGDKKASTILSSARRIAESDAEAKEAEKQEAEEAEEQEAEETEEQEAEEQEAEEAEEQEAEEAEEQEAEEAVEVGDGADRPSGRTNGRGGDSRPAAAARQPGGAGVAGRTGGTATTAAEAPSTAESTDQQPDEQQKSLHQQFVETLRCPACGHDRFDVGSSTMTCQACQRQFNLQNGIADLAPPAPTDQSLTQKVMESRTYTRFYEEFLRPKLTSVVSERSMREEYRLAADFLDFDDDIRLLDVGCGTANFTRYLAQRIGLAETPATHPGLPLVVGMDLSWPMLENARRNIQQENLEDKVFLLRGDGTRIPVRRGAYNRLHCAGTLHMMNDIDEALRNFARVLEPNGIAVIGTFVLGKGLIRRLLKRVAEFPTHFHWFSRDELLRRIERAGFEVVDNSLAGDAITVKARRI